MQALEEAEVQNAIGGLDQPRVEEENSRQRTEENTMSSRPGTFLQYVQRIANNFKNLGNGDILGSRSNSQHAGSK